MGRRDFNGQGFDLNSLERMRDQRKAEVMNLRISLATRYYGELVKPNAEATRDKIAASKDSDERIDVDFSLEAMLARELADTILVVMGLLEPKARPADQSESVANGEAKPSIILTP